MIDLDTKKALVLCGGGAKGGYHIGVWKALKEIGYIERIGSKKNGYWKILKKYKSST